MLDILEPPQDPEVDLRDELRELEQLWLERLQPWASAATMSRADDKDLQRSFGKVTVMGSGWPA